MAADRIAAEIRAITLAAASVDAIGIDLNRHPSQTRTLLASEQALADQVFEGQVPYDKVRITDTLGLGGGFYTMRQNNGTYLIHVGKDLFDDLTKPDGFHIADSRGTPVLGRAPVLIHELTHVWQGRHWPFATEYELDSFWHQAVHFCNRDAAYAYKTGGKWSHYTAEQQAMIVQDWFTGTGGDDSSVPQDPSSNLFHYIKDHIQTGQNAGA
jgi:hypothetical protein